MCAVLSRMLVLWMPLALLAIALSTRPAAPPEGDLFAGGAPRSRALLVALHGGSRTRTPRDCAEQLFAALDGPARSARLRLLVPVAPFDGDAREESLAGQAAGGVWQVPWTSAAGEQIVFGLIDEEVAARRADARRCHLAGVGAGVAGALQLAARRPERIAALACWSGAPAPLWDAERRVVGLVDDVGRALAGTPLYLWTARDDGLLDRAALDLLLQAPRAGGRVPLLHEQGEGGHGLPPEGPRAGLAFLAAQRRRGRRRRPLSAS